MWIELAFIPAVISTPFLSPSLSMEFWVTKDVKNKTAVYLYFFKHADILDGTYLPFKNIHGRRLLERDVHTVKYDILRPYGNGHMGTLPCFSYYI